MYKYDATQFNKDILKLANQIPYKKYDGIYGVPRGGVNVAIALSMRMMHLPLISDLDNESLDSNVLIVDDIVDSGRTRQRFKGRDFACLHIKKRTPKKMYPTYYASKENDDFIEYFWEVNEQPAEDAIVRIIEMIGDDPNRNGIIETPKRVIESFKELYAGYNQEPKDVFKTFDDEQEQFGGLVYLKDIEFYSMCEHHMLPFLGNAFIAYIPNGPVIGTSKMARLLDIFARRLQMQERIGEQVTNALMEYLKPKGAACLIEAKHLCIACRGVKKQSSVMGYSSLKGAFMNNAESRAELMSLWARKQ